MRSLDYREPVCDGVYDVWGKFPELAAAEGAGLPSLGDLHSLPARPSDPREVRDSPVSARAGPVKV